MAIILSLQQLKMSQNNSLKQCQRRQNLNEINIDDSGESELSISHYLNIIKDDSLEKMHKPYEKPIEPKSTVSITDTQVQVKFLEPNRKLTSKIKQQMKINRQVQQLHFPSYQRKPMFRRISRNSKLYIKVNLENEKKYDITKMGLNAETKAIFNYYYLEKKFLLRRIQHYHFTPFEIHCVKNFKNNLQGIRIHYGFDKQGEQDFGNCDEIREICLQHCRQAAQQILHSKSDFIKKLDQIKYLNKIELMVIEPEKVSSWKQPVP